MTEYSVLEQSKSTLVAPSGDSAASVRETSGVSGSVLPLRMVAAVPTPTSAWRARRQSPAAPSNGNGSPVDKAQRDALRGVKARARYQRANGALTLALADESSPVRVEATAHATLGLRVLGDAGATDLLGALDGTNVEFIEGGTHLVSCDPSTRTLRFDAHVAACMGLEPVDGKVTARELSWELFGVKTTLSADEVLAGFGVVSACAQAYGAACNMGSNQREALHRTLDVYARVASDGPQAVAPALKLLRSVHLDAGNVFARFLESATDSGLAQEIDGSDLGDLVLRSSADLSNLAAKAAAEQDASVLERVTWALKWRDRWVTWLVGQDWVDMPYDQDRVAELLREAPGEDIDAQRRAIHQLLSTSYDRKAEGENIERISERVEQEGRLLVCGRISRAFGNQTQLLSAAAYVDREALVPLVSELERHAAGLDAVATQVARVTTLVSRPSSVSYAQLRGALWHLEEAVRNYQASATKRINSAKEADAERLVGRRGFDAYQAELEKLTRRVTELYSAATRLRVALESAPRRPAAYLILQQRFFPGETQLLALANSNRDTHPGKIEQLRDLTRKGGHNRYASEGSGVVTGADGSMRRVSWISKCHHWIEAIPMFIKERIVRVPVVVGGQKTTVERIQTEVDQRGMEAFFRFAAQFWAENCDEVADSEHVTLAREFLVRQLHAEEATQLAESGKSTYEAAVLEVARKRLDAGTVGAAAALVEASYRTLIERVGVEMERGELGRLEALRRVLLGTDSAPASENALAEVLISSERERTSLPEALLAVASARGLEAQAARLSARAFRKRRPISTLHILTTESAGMTEGYVQTWLETEIALHNVIRAKGWEREVEEKLGEYRIRIQAIAEKVVGELGMEAVVQESMNEGGMSRAAALQMLLATNRPLAEEVSRLAVLLEEEEREAACEVDPRRTVDPIRVDAHIHANRDRLASLAVPKVVEANGRAIEIAIEEAMAGRSVSREAATLATIEADEDFKADLEFYVRSIARQEVIEELDRCYPELNLLATQGEYLRNHTQLALSFARRAVVAAHQAQQLTEHPLYNYRARGGKKRYNLLYTPSRVDLGAEEMDSIVRWAQWVGGADRSAVNAGREFYSLINEAGVEVRPSLAWQEIQKTSENANMTAGKAFANSVALLINSVGEGDQQLMADQMYLRHDEDRGTPPASEGYGGYCVPKDGLFLAFVLELKNETKLRQMGIPPAMHGVVMRAAAEAIHHYHDFSTDFEWQLWVAKKLLSQDKLRKYISEFLGVRRLRDEELVVFNLTKTSEAIQHLGQPWHEVTPGDGLLSNLAAQWAVGKMIIGGEQVQRFMVFYKAWLIQRALAKAGRAGVGRVVLTAEYKTVQDIRYSAGNRIFEILAKTGEHLTYSLDEEGQNLAFLMMYGFTPLPEIEGEQKAIGALPGGSERRERLQKTLDRRRRVALRVYESMGLDDAKDRSAILSLKEKFPPAAFPADLRLVSSTMSSTEDIFYYTDDTQLTQIADRVQQVLSDVGLTEEQMRANAYVYGGELDRWALIKDLPKPKRRTLLDSSIVYRVGSDTFEVALRGAIHALVLRLRGPGRSYLRDVQGADVVNTAIAFPELVELLDNPPKLVALMLEGNPHSALALTDGVSGRGARMLTYQDVMLFFAACDRLAGEGRGSYMAIGLGEGPVARLREQMRSRRRRAAELREALETLATAQSADRPPAVERVRTVFAGIIEQVVQEDEVQDIIAEEERVKRYKRHRARDARIREALTRLSVRPEIAELDFGTWLALGGLYDVAGRNERDIQALRARFEQGLSLLPESNGASRRSAGEGVERIVAALVRPKFVPHGQKFEQVLGRESSSKAVHAGETEARERRKALRVRQLRSEVFNLREKGFKDAYTPAQGKDLETCHREAHRVLDALLGYLDHLYRESDSTKRHQMLVLINTNVGAFLACAYHGMVAAIEELYPTTNSILERQKREFLAHLPALYGGREIVFEHWKRISGGYQDLGDVGRLILALGDDRPKLRKLTLAIELFYTTLALSQTVEHIQVERSGMSFTRFWDDLAVFFAETINDHDSLYLPWDYVRGVEKGVGFDAMPLVELYALAFERHHWLYRYFRTILTRGTEIADLSVQEQDALLGNFLGGRETTAIGGNGPTREERAWRAYNQLRETAFMRNDGFPVPEVFVEFDPDIISADERVNVVFLFPVGRTHISRAFREGPTLNQELIEAGRNGANLIVSRYDEFVAVEGAKRPVLHCTSGHLCLTREELVKALTRHKDFSKSEAEAHVAALEAAGALTPKGVRVAVRFTRPIIAGGCVPYHGNVLYTSGQLEDAGLPYTVQSLVHSDITYDKSLYPEVYQDSGVHMPPEIDWKTEYQQGISREQALQQITEGRAGFEGLRRFAESYPIVLIKGAAESGARNLRVFEIGLGKGAWDEAELAAAATFVYERALKQNMVIQEAARTTPELWASPLFMTNFVDRQVAEWNAAVVRDRHPRSQIYGSLRIIATSSHPSRPYDLTHKIALASLQVATNVGRGGTLEPLLDEFIQDRYREQIRRGMADQVPLVMNALHRYAGRYAAEFKARHGREVGEDLRGVSYGWPAYLMLDYLITPVFERDGKLVDIEPRFDERGERIESAVILEDGQGRFEGKITGWRLIHLEPNVGIGLWDRFSLREEEWERAKSRQDGREFDWSKVGQDDRIVLRNFAISGEEYLRANFGH